MEAHSKHFSELLGFVGRNLHTFSFSIDNWNTQAIPPFIA